MTRYQYLLGANKDGDIVFGEISANTRDNNKMFSASFSTVRPFNASEIDFETYCEDWVDNCDDSFKYQLCCDYDCCPSELASHIADNNNIDEIIDCSLYNECLDIDGDDWYFESSCCGQHDTRNEIVEYTNKEAYDTIIKLWDEYHLKNMDDYASVAFETVRDLLTPINEEEWIIDYIKHNLM